MTDNGWCDANLANWDERVDVHLALPMYDLTELRAGHGKLHAIEEAELGPVAGKRVLHLQCHFGRDTLALAQRGAEHEFMHPLGEVATGLIDAGLTLDFLHEHDGVPWRMFACLAQGADGLYRWPDRPWLPLAFSIRATRAEGRGQIEL